MWIIWGSPQVPREVRMITPSRFKGSGPKKDVKAPGCPIVTSTSLGIRAILPTASMKPPWPERTAAMTATMPASMMMPWIKSLMAVAMYPPSITYTAVITAMRITHHS